MIYTKEATRIENNYKVFTGLTHKGNCIYCGDEFMSRSIAAKYCSQRCKNDKQINQRAEMILEKKRTANNCIVCNNPIKQNPRGKIKKYCSNKCKQKNYRKKPGACLNNLE